MLEKEGKKSDCNNSAKCFLPKLGKVSSVNAKKSPSQHNSDVSFSSIMEAHVISPTELHHLWNVASDLTAAPPGLTRYGYKTTTERTTECRHCGIDAGNVVNRHCSCQKKRET